MAGRWDAIIWDFNGTLVDDVDLALRSINTMLARRDLAPVTRDVYRSVFGFPLSEYYARLGMDLSGETMQGLADEFHDEYLPGLPKCELQDGVREILDRAARAGSRQFVLSALEEFVLRQAVGNLGIADRFVAIYGLNHRLADSKLERGRELSGRHELDGRRVVFIGDMDHDAEVAEALGFEVALVAQGHQSGERLRACGYRVLGSYRERESEFDLPN
ncbi:MAG: HAD family hydrolase [Candidatus Bipolaricaulota bacterium]|nr:HAD family hydrolase [Candidatus Bipolaricaulota bacterium]